MSILPKASRPGDVRFMPAIGITGGISTGKSTFVECLRELLPAATFFDADRAAHALLNRPEVEKQIRNEFGPTAFSTAGDLNRTKLRAIVFANATKNRACSISEVRSPLFQTTWSARLIFSSSGICELIICSASAFFIDIRFRKRARCSFCEQATTTTRSHKLSPPVS